MTSTHARGTAEMTAAMIISGTVGLFVVLSGQPVLNIVFWRCVFGAGVLLAVCAGLGLFRRRRISLPQAGLAALGGVAIAINWILLFAAYPRASISVATAVYNTQPFMLAVMAAVIFGEKLTASRLGWMVMAFAGMLAIIQGRPGAVTEAGAGGYLAGVGLALGAAFFYAAAAIIAKKLKGIPPHLIALIQLATGLLMLAPLADFGQMPADLHAWALIVTLGVIHTGFMYVLLYGAIQKLPASFAGSLSFIYPAVAIVADFLVFGIRLEPLQMAGVAVILLAAAGAAFGWSPTGRPAERTGSC